MTRRYLRIKIDAKAKFCGACGWLSSSTWDPRCGLFRDIFHEPQGLHSGVHAPNVLRCPQCVEAEGAMR